MLWREDLTTTNAGLRRVDFEFAVEDLADRLGAAGGDLTRETVRLDLEARLVPLAGETDGANNARPLRLAAALGGRRILILDGRPRWETRYLRNALGRDPRYAVRTVIHHDASEALPRGDGPGQFPDTRAGLLGFDLILFGEFPAAALTAEEAGWVREFVETRGGGLIFVDGSRGLLGDLPDPPLADLLPVRRGTGPPPAKPGPLRLTDAGAALDALRLEPDAEANRALWSALPAPHVLVPTEALPDATVLVEVGEGADARPAVVTRTFGAGRVVYLSFDETWRWRYRAADTYHQRAWNQLAAFAMPRPYAVRDAFAALDAGAVEYAPGQSAAVRATLRDADGRPAEGRVVDAILSRDGREVGTVTLSPDPAVPGGYRGATPPLEPGEYAVRLRAAGFAADALKATTGFAVAPPDAGETADTAADFALLAAMAEASGGAALREEDAGRLIGLLAPLSDGRVVETDTPIWQSYWWFAAILIPLSVEWALRKRAGLL